MFLISQMPKSWLDGQVEILEAGMKCRGGALPPLGDDGLGDQYRFSFSGSGKLSAVLENSIILSGNGIGAYGSSRKQPRNRNQRLRNLKNLSPKEE
ncbi:MAG: hypothetical protein A2W25_03350 [candidate division Zixibacteria bacterium RBG_16_53_22]|nr:MAG: hypothetical protein A2W25_03350 [candidate division Zixibacteria bacterium RBG_16_53_22]